MSILAIILMNIGAAAILVAIIATAMLLPSRLDRPFATGHSHRQKLALRRHLQLAGRQRRPARSTERGLRPIPD